MGKVVIPTAVEDAATIVSTWLDDAGLRQEACVVRQRFKLLPPPFLAPGDGVVGKEPPDVADALEDYAEAIYWRFDARRKGLGEWKQAPMSERDAFKAEVRNAISLARSMMNLGEAV